MVEPRQTASASRSNGRRDRGPPAIEHGLTRTYIASPQPRRPGRPCCSTSGPPR
jgi:hypothetical protein